MAEGQWLARHKFASSLMDISDGLGADLPRLAKASGVGFQVDPTTVPRARGATLAQALNDGEDYELLFTASPANAKILKKKWPFSTPVRSIGMMTAPGEESRGLAFAHGFDHFK
jgi:thiamine-monophosphate kinase